MTISRPATNRETALRVLEWRAAPMTCEEIVEAVRSARDDQKITSQAIYAALCYLSSPDDGRVRRVSKGVYVVATNGTEAVKRAETADNDVDLFAEVDAACEALERIKRAAEGLPRKRAVQDLDDKVALLDLLCPLVSDHNAALLRGIAADLREVSTP